MGEIRVFVLTEYGYFEILIPKNDIQTFFELSAIIGVRSAAARRLHDHLECYSEFYFCWFVSLNTSQMVE